MIQMTPLFWFILGIALIIFEVMTPGLVTLFFGLAALTVAVIVWLIPSLAQSWQWLLFSILSILFILLLRKSLKKVFSGISEVSENPNAAFIDKLVTVTEAITPNRPGRVEFNGTSWIATSTVDMPVGAIGCVIDQKNLTLTIKPS